MTELTTSDMIENIEKWTRARTADHMNLRAVLEIIKHAHPEPETDFSRWVRQLADLALTGDVRVDTFGDF